MANEEQIGFHKGSLATLAKEREELLKIVKITEQLMEAHVKALKDLGVDLEAEAKKVQEQAEEQKETKNSNGLDGRVA
ncbi:MAG: hypothetical protein CMH62_00680 [Nanoarchaeota archaeon]|nr:hypothetical protein [Nanoarchaeota archaeon]